MLETRLEDQTHPARAIGEQASTVASARQPVRPAEPLRRSWGPALLAALFFVFLAAYAVYLFAFASRSYSVEVRFAVRQADVIRPQQGPSLLGGAMLTTLTESNAVVQYLRSRDALNGIEAQLPLQEAFGRAEIDILQRLPHDATPERRLRFMDKMIRPHFDHTSGIVSVEVRAFSPEEAQSLAVLVETLSENLVNRMSLLARRGLLAAAERDAAEAELRLGALRDETRDLRERTERLDPRRNAVAADELRAKLEVEISIQRALLDQQRRFMAENGLQLVQQRERVEALERELREQVRRGTAGTDSALPATLRQFEALEFQVMNAQKAFDATMATLERARSDANRQQIYLSPIVRPSLPVQAAYPKYWHDLATATALGALAGLLLLLLFRTLREHLG